MGKELGKITRVEFGHGGYQDAMIGISFTLGGGGWGTCDFWGEWATEVHPGMQWTDEDRINKLGSVCMKINELLLSAKVESISDLKEIPVEVIFENQKLVSWRVLDEVL